MNDNHPVLRIKLIDKSIRKLKNFVHAFIKYLILFLTILEKLKSIFDF